MTAGLKRGGAESRGYSSARTRSPTSIVTQGGISAPSPSQPVDSSSDTRLLGPLRAVTLQY